MSSLAHKNPLELLRKFREEFLTRSNLTNYDRNSKIRAFSESVTDEFLTLREEMVRANRGRDLLYATGKELDTHGERFGLPRRKATFSEVGANELNLTYYVSSGNFGSYNSSNPIVITSGTIISSDPNQNELNAQITYTVTEDTTLLASASIGYISARATIIGSGSNLGQKVLRNHNFTNYTSSSGGALKVVNFYPILNGSNDETDEVYRFRLLNFYNSLLQANETKMKLLALEVPGVVNTRIEPAYYGIGTSAVLVLGAENQSNASLVDSVQSKVDQWQIPGSRVVATSATEVFFDFIVRIKPHRTLTSNEVSKLKSEVNRAFIAYYKTLVLGSIVDLSSALKYIQKNINSFASINLKNKDETLRKVFIRKGYAGSVTDEREQLIASSFQLANNEFASLGTITIEVD